MSIVRIRKNPFDRLVARAYETLRVESIGTVFGEKVERKSGDKFIVEEIDPSQIASRGKNFVEVDNSADRRFHSIVGDGIGGFHSHPYEIGFWRGESGIKYARVNLSDVDLKSFMEFHPGGIEIVVALNPAEHLSKLNIGEHLVSGCFSDNERKFRFSIGAYYLDKCGNGAFRARRAAISVPVRYLKNYF
jgi:hypothetical protein